MNRPDCTTVTPGQSGKTFRLIGHPLYHKTEIREFRLKRLQKVSILLNVRGVVISKMKPTATTDEGWTHFMDYLLLLRGINVGGKHRVPMAQLREQLTATGFTNVRSYINSGNLFVTSAEPFAQCEQHIQALLTTEFDFPIDFRLISRPEFLADLALAPDWWGIDPELRHNALFKLNTYEDDNDSWLKEHVTSDYDQILITPNLIFWTSTLKLHFSRSFYSKIFGISLYRQTSARNFNTTTKLKKILEEFS